MDGAVDINNATIEGTKGQRALNLAKPVRTVADRMEWSLNGANSGRFIHDVAPKADECE